MSYGSRTQHPSVSRTRGGRGRGRGSYSPHVTNRPEETYDQGQGHPADGGGDEGELDHTHGRRRGVGERSMQRNSRGAHYVLPPDPSKRSRLNQTAMKEEAEHRKYKEEQRERTAQSLAEQPPRQLGGVEYKLDQIAALREQQEKQQQKEARFEKVRSRQRREEYRRQQREKEEAEIARKKEDHREKAQQYEARKEEKQRVDQEELRRRRLKYYDGQ